MSQSELCYRVVYSGPDLSAAALNELSRRGLACQPGMAAAEAARRDANSRAVEAVSMELIRQGQRPPAPPVVTCTTSGTYPYQITTCR